MNLFHALTKFGIYRNEWQQINKVTHAVHKSEWCGAYHSQWLILLSPERNGSPQSRNPRIQNSHLELQQQKQTNGHLYRLGKIAISKQI